jgi:hypothetical protein
MAKTLHPALLISVVLHLLLLWFIAHKMVFSPTENKNPTQHSSIQITITHPRIEPDTFKKHKRTSFPNADTTSAVTPEITQQQEHLSSQKYISEKKEHRDTSANKPNRLVSSAKIIASSTAIINKLASEDNDNTGTPNSDSVSAILDRALNPKREAPGITTQADGTTRVVTEMGFTYCIKPLDDWKIIDPGDDMRVSVYCN